jgi:hypothetical protein
MVQAALPGFLLAGRTPPGPEERGLPVPDADQPSRRCRKCDVVQPIDRFAPHRNGRGGWRRVCRRCRAAYLRARRQIPEHRERELLRERRGYARRREQVLERAKVRRERLRTEVLLAYDHRCACCGECTREFLAVDHIRGGGKQHLKQAGLSPGVGFYRWLKRQGFPRDDFRLLCHNCNQSRGYYGHCPHERRLGV